MNWWIPAKLRKAVAAAVHQPAQPAVARTGTNELLAALASGDTDTFSLLYRQHAPPIYRFVLASSASREIAEEVTQETFLFLLTEWRRYDASRGELQAWLIGVARQLLRKTWRGERASYHTSEAGEEALRQEPEVLQELLIEEEQSRLINAISQLPEVYREALVLHALEGRSYAEVAALLDCALGTVRSRIARAKEMLARSLAAPIRGHAPPIGRAPDTSNAQGEKGGNDAERNVAAEI